MKHKFKRLAAFTMVLALVLSMAISFGAAPEAMAASAKRIGDYKVGDSVWLGEANGFAQYIVVQKGNPDSKKYDDTFDDVVILLRRLALQTSTPVMNSDTGKYEWLSVDRYMEAQVYDAIRNVAVKVNWPTPSGQSSSGCGYSVTTTNSWWAPLSPQEYGVQRVKGTATSWWAGDFDIEVYDKFSSVFQYFGTDKAVNNRLRFCGTDNSTTQQGVTDKHSTRCPVYLDHGSTDGSTANSYTHTLGVVLDSDGSLQLDQYPNSDGAAWIPKSLSAYTTRYATNPAVVVKEDTIVDVNNRIQDGGSTQPTSKTLNDYSVGDIIKIKTPTSRVLECRIIQKGRPYPLSLYGTDFNDTVILQWVDPYVSLGNITSNTKYCASYIYPGGQLDDTCRQDIERFLCPPPTELSAMIKSVSWPYADADGTVHSGADGHSASVVILSAAEMGATGTEAGDPKDGGVFAYYASDKGYGRSDKRPPNTWTRTPLPTNSTTNGVVWHTDGEGRLTTGDGITSSGIPQDYSLPGNKVPDEKVIYPAICLKAESPVNDGTGILTADAQPATPSATAKPTSSATAKPSATASATVTPAPTQAPVSEKALKDCNVGDVVLLKEKNTETGKYETARFIIVQKGKPDSAAYDKTFNNTVMLLRENTTDSQAWPFSGTVKDPVCSLSTTDSYLGRLDPSIQQAAVKANWPYDLAVGYVSYAKSKITIPSALEVGGKSQINTGDSAGTVLAWFDEPVAADANAKRIATNDAGKKGYWWTRSGSTLKGLYQMITDDGLTGGASNKANQNSIRPLLCLPDSAVFHADGTVTAPRPKPESEYDVGDEVKLLEDGKLVDFIVVHLGNPDPDIYDEAFDDMMFLLRKNYYGDGTGVPWDQTPTGRSNNYDASNINKWLNTTYLSLLDPTIQNAAVEVKWPYSHWDGTNQAVTLDKGLAARVSIPSLVELGYSEGLSHHDSYGAVFDYFGTKTGANAKRMTTFDNGTTGHGWTKSPTLYSSQAAWHVTPTGTFDCSYSTATRLGARPVICMLASTGIGPDGRVKGSSNIPVYPTLSPKPSQSAQPSSSPDSTSSVKPGSSATAKPSNGGSDGSNTASPSPSSGATNKPGSSQSPNPAGSASAGASAKPSDGTGTQAPGSSASPKPSPSSGGTSSPSAGPSDGNSTPSPKPTGSASVITDPENGTTTFTVPVKVNREKYPDAIAVTGTLVDRNTGEPIPGPDGKPFTATEQLDANGEAVLVFKDIPNECLAGHDVGVRVSLLDKDGNVIPVPDGGGDPMPLPTWSPEPSVSPDPSGQRTTITVPVQVDKEKYPDADSVRGTLVDKDTGEPILDKDGNPITVTEKLDENGRTTLVFEGIDDEILKGHNVGVKVDILDKDGNVIGTGGSLPDIVLPVDPDPPVITPDPDRQKITVTIVVPVDREKFPTAASVTGMLIDKDTREPIRDKDGNLITTSAPIDASTNIATLVFRDIDPEILDGHTIDALIEIRDSSGKIIGTNGTQPGVTIPDPTTPPTGITDPIVTTDPDSGKVTITVTVRVDMERLPDASTVTGMLIDRDTGEPICNKDGSLITSSAPVDPASGTATLVFRDIDKDVLTGHNIGVRLEVRDKNGNVIGTNDGNKPAPGTDKVPPITVDPPTGITNPSVTTDPTGNLVTITVTVPVDMNRLPDAATVTGTLIDRDTMQPILDRDGNPITSSAPVDAATSSATLVFRDIERSILAGHNIGVRIDVLDRDGNVIGTNNGNQPAPGTDKVPPITVEPPAGITDPIVTTDPDTGKVTITVTVAVDKSRLPDAETVRGTLIDRNTKEPILDRDGNPITSSAPVNPGTSTATLIFRDIDRDVLEGHEIGVKIEVLDKDGNVIATNDGTQPAPGTDKVPEIKIPVTGIVDPVVTPDPDTKLVTITVTVPVDRNALPDAASIVGTLIDKTTGEPILDRDGNPITATAPIDPATNTATLTFRDLDPEILRGHDLGVKIDVLDGSGNVIGTNDGTKPAPGQDRVPTIKIPTFPVVDVTDITQGTEAGTITVSTRLTNLTPGTDYKVTGWLVYSPSGEDVVIGGQAVTAEETFMAVSTGKNLDLTFYVADMNAIKGRGLSARLSVEGDGHLLTVTPPDPKPGGWRPVPGEDPYVRVEDIDVTKPSQNGSNPAEFTATIAYEGLTPGTEYVLTATLLNKDTGEPVLVNGMPVQVIQAFRPDQPNGKLQVTFSVKPEDVAGITLAIGAVITRADNGEVVADSNNNEGGNTGSGNPAVPPLDGSASKPEEKDPFADVNKITLEQNEKTGLITITVIGKVDNLDPDEEYTITATLLDKATGKPVLIGGRPVTVTGTLNRETGEVTFVFRDLDPEPLRGVDLGILMEVKNSRGEVVAIANSLKPQPGQSTIDTVRVPGGSNSGDNNPGGNTPGGNTPGGPDVPGTDNPGGSTIRPGTPQVGDGEDGNKIITVEVPYSGLVPGNEYEITGVLIDKNTGEPILDKDGRPITFTQMLDPSSPDGTVTITFSVPAELLEGRDWDIKTTLWENGQIAMDSHGDHLLTPTVGIDHIDADIKSAGQLSTLTVTVAYTNVPVGVTSECRGTLVSTTDGQPILVDGHPITSSVTFIPLSKNGTVTLTFEFDTAYVDAETVAVRVSLVHGDNDPFAVGGGKDDPNAYIIPRVPGTVVTATQIEERDGRVFLVATVGYHGLDEGEEYTLDGLLVDMSTGLPVGPRKADTNPFSEAMKALFGGSVAHAAGEIRAQTIFVPISPSGTEQLAFEFNREDADLTNAGVKATLYKSSEGPDAILDEQYGNVPDIDGGSNDPNGGGTDDPNAAVSPKIESASAAVTGGGRTIAAAPGQKITGAVSMTGLTEGTLYTVTGTLMKQDGSSPLTVAGAQVTASRDFYAMDSTQTVSLPLTFDATGLAGTQLYIAWTLMSDGSVLDKYDASLSGQVISIIEAADGSGTGTGSGNAAGTGSGSNQNMANGTGANGAGSGTTGNGSGGGITSNMTSNGAGTTVRTGQTAATGDETNIVIPIVCAAAAGAFIVFWLIRRKRLSA